MPNARQRRTPRNSARPKSDARRLRNVNGDLARSPRARRIIADPRLRLAQRLEALGVTLSEAPQWLPLTTAEASIVSGRSARALEAYRLSGRGGPAVRIIDGRAVYTIGGIRRWLSGAEVAP